MEQSDNGHIYVAIDLKSFYASVECRERGLDPLDTNLVVADASRTDKTICLAVTPSLKSLGIPGRCRLFEVKQRVREVNILRRSSALRESAPREDSQVASSEEGSSCQASVLRSNPRLAIDFLIAPPRMAYYMEYSTRIYGIYMKYVAPEDMIVYSIDEVFMDVTTYLPGSGLSPEEFARKIIRDVYQTTGITATAGIGTNLFLCKTAMDIVAKHIPADESGVRIARLDEMEFRRKLWSHRPLTDFWQIGHGYENKLKQVGIFTMGDIARCSVQNEELLYTLFGKNAELLIDHAWGIEPCTIEDVKKYRPDSISLSSGQVLHCPYDAGKAKIVLLEMADALADQLLEKKLAADQLVITIGYDIENLSDPNRRKRYRGAVVTDRYGRQIPKHAHGSINLDRYTSLARQITKSAAELYDRIVNPDLLVRRLNLAANHVLEEKNIPVQENYEQLSLFTDYAALQTDRKAEEKQRERERKIQEAALAIKKKYGKNALLKGVNLREGATGRERNDQIGGHKA